MSAPTNFPKYIVALPDGDYNVVSYFSNYNHFMAVDTTTSATAFGMSRFARDTEVWTVQRQNDSLGGYTIQSRARTLVPSSPSYLGVDTSTTTATALMMLSDPTSSAARWALVPREDYFGVVPEAPSFTMRTLARDTNATFVRNSSFGAMSNSASSIYFWPV